MLAIPEPFARFQTPPHNASMPATLHFNLDDAWDAGLLPMPTVDARHLGPQLRYCAPARTIQAALAPLENALGDNRFILYGSGDFHYLAAWWLRALLNRHPPGSPITLISFDNHPDWDIRPPRWGCGGWINRALELPEVARASVWGCGNFELAFPARLFRSRRALSSGRLEIHAWAQRQSPATARHFNCMTADAWRERFTRFASSLAETPVYITIDLDCLASPHAVTNWENGLFTPADVVWALGQLQPCRILGGDLCGAYSPPCYARAFQRFAGGFDHPRLPPPPADARAINHATLSALWPALTTN